MSSRRIEHHPILGMTQHRTAINFKLDDQTIPALRGDTIASALWANGIRSLRYQEETGTPRGIYCNIGHCYECRVTVNGFNGVRACLTLVQDGMEVRRGTQLPLPFREGDEPL